MKAAIHVLTMGTRPDDLARAVASATGQRNADVEVVVVVNGARLTDPPAGAKVIELPENLGVSGGRNRGIETETADVIFFIDDDAAYATDDAVERALSLFERRADLGILSFRIEDPAGAPGQRRHVPRLRAGDRMRSSDVTTYLGGACAIRREVFDRCGPYPEQFFFGHEETDLAWRALDAGYAIRYEASIVVHHPAEPAARRQPTHYERTSRNRVLLARRRVPWAIAAVYLLVWLSLELARAPDNASRRAYLGGFLAGWRAEPGERRPMSWRTVWRMTRLGRPPIV